MSGTQAVPGAYGRASAVAFAPIPGHPSEGSCLRCFRCGVSRLPLFRAGDDPRPVCRTCWYLDEAAGYHLVDGRSRP